MTQKNKILIARVGKRIRLHRRLQIMSQRDLSLKSGVRHTYISDIELGTRPNVSISTIKKLCDALLISVDSILY